MFLRASFARGKEFRGNGIRRWRWMRSSGQMLKLLKNVEILAQPEAKRFRFGMTIPPEGGAYVAGIDLVL